jgi:molecular chaperone GrpE
VTPRPQSSPPRPAHPASQPSPGSQAAGSSQSAPPGAQLPQPAQAPGAQGPGPGAQGPGAQGPGAQGPGAQRPGAPSTPTGSPAAVAAGDADLSATVAELRAQVAQLEDAWRRALADLDNLRKRTARDTAGRQAAERARVAAEWLPVLDNLELALEHAGGAGGAIVEGIRAVRDQAISVLARLGFPRRDDLGAKFDPALHEAVATVPDPDAPDGTVVRVLRPGYGDGEHQLRPAAVVVAAQSAGSG